MNMPDYVERRIVVEFGRQYAYVYMTTADGKLVAEREESFKQPFRLERQEALEEAHDLWGVIYDHLNDSINFALPEVDDDDADSEQED